MLRLSEALSLPDDGFAGALAARVWRPDQDGPSVVALRPGGVVDITEAAQALRPLASEWAAVLLALGLSGSGFLAVPILTGSSAYAVAEALGGVGVIAASTLVGVLINFVGINPIRALFGAAVINGFLAPPLLVIIMVISSNKGVMGERVNGRWSNILGWAATAWMFAAAIALVLTW